MAKSRALSVITSKAKHLKKLHPHKFDHLKKKDRWPKGYIKAASAAYKSGSTAVGKKRKAAPRKKKARKRSVSAARSAKGRALVKYVEKTSTERVMAGKRKKRTKAKKKSNHTRRVRMAGAPRRRRSVSGTGGNMGLILGLGIGAIAVYLLTKKTTPTTTAYPTTLPPVSQTGNYTRNTQSSDIVNYAMAAGLTITAITSLINTLNSSSDSQVSNIYDSINTTGDISSWV